MQGHSWEVLGHDWAVDFLRRSLRHNRIRQAYLITGTPNIGKTQFANIFAMALNCEHPELDRRPCYECRSCRLVMSGNHPDIVYSELDSDTGALRIEALRAVQQRLSLKPYQSRYKVAIVGHFDHARPQAQDAFLKTLEEPPAHAILILLAPSTEDILSTILSRCQIIPLRPVSVAQVRHALTTHFNAAPDDAELIARLSGGRIGWAINALRDPTILSDRAEALDLLEEAVRSPRRDRFDLADQLSRDRLALPALLELWQSYWRDVLLLAEGSAVRLCNLDREVSIRQLLYEVDRAAALKALKATAHALDLLATNAQPRLLLEVMFLDYPGLA